MSFQCRTIDQKKACDKCDSGGTALPCFGFRLEHLVYQMLNCERFVITHIHQDIRANYRFGGVGEFPRFSRWGNRAMLIGVVTISFSDCENTQRIPSISTLKNMKTGPLRYSWFFHDEWVEAFYNIVDAACQYRDTNSREVSSFQP